MTVTSTIGTNARNYSTLAAWAASLPATLADAYVGECYNDSEFTNNGVVLQLSGVATTATFNITVTTGPGQSFRDNPNAQTNALSYNQANGVGIRTTAANYNQAIVNQCNYVNFIGLQVSCNLIGGQSSTAFESNNVLYVNVEDCLFQSYNNYSPVVFMFGGSPGSCTIRNSIVIGLSTSGRITTLANGVVPEFCTFVSPSDAGSSSVAVGYSTTPFKNCAFFGINAGGLPTTSASYTTCMTDMASAPSGLTTVPYAGQFVSTVSTAMDYRIVSTSNLIGAATADTTYGATDIVGTARPQGGNWDIGCWEYFSATPPAAQFATSVVCSASATAALNTSITLYGALNGSASASGTLTDPAATLASNASSQTVSTASLSTSIRLSSNAASTSIITDALTTSIKLSSSVASSSASNAAITTEIQFKANAASTSAITDALTTKIALDANATSLSNASATIGEMNTLYATASVVTLSNASLTTVIALNQNVSVVVSQTGAATGMPGTLPQNWGFDAIDIDTEVVAVENNSIDIRFVGTPTATYSVFYFYIFQTFTPAPYILSADIEMVAGTTTNINQNANATGLVFRPNNSFPNPTTPNFQLNVSNNYVAYYTINATDTYNQAAFDLIYNDTTTPVDITLRFSNVLCYNTQLAVSDSNLHAALTTAIDLNASVNVSTTLGNNITTTIAFIGNATVNSAITATLNQADLISANATANTSASASITTSIEFVSNATANTNISASLIEPDYLSANGVAQTFISALLTTEIPFASAINASSTSVSELTTTIGLDSNIAVISSATGYLISITDFSANATASITGSGSLSTQILMDVSIDATTSVSAYFSSSLETLFFANAVVNSSASGYLVEITYEVAVLQSNPTFYYEMNDSTNTFIVDQIAGNDAYLSDANFVFREPSLKVDDANTSIQFNNDYMTTNETLTLPSAYSIEVLVETLNAGIIASFVNPLGYDDVLYINDSGEVVFSYFNGYRNVLKSSVFVNDGKAHHIAVSNYHTPALYIDSVIQ